MSQLETGAFIRVALSGQSYASAGAAMGKPIKSIDNAMQRAKVKLARAVRRSERAMTGEQELVIDCLCEQLQASPSAVAKWTRIPHAKALQILAEFRDLGYVISHNSGRGMTFTITEKGRRAAIAPSPEVWTA